MLAQKKDGFIVFYDLYCKLCTQKGVTPTRAAVEIGLSKGTPTTWKQMGTTPQAAQLAKIARYFGVTIDYLLGNETKKEPTTNGADILDSVDIAFLTGYKELTEENKAVLRDMVQLMRKRQEDGKEE